MPDSRHYLYAVGFADQLDPAGVTGLDDAPAHTITADDLAFIATPIARDQIRPQRRNLAAHQQVLKHLLDRVTVLPMAFGLVADTADDAQAMLREMAPKLRPQLERVHNRIEMGLRVRWDVPDPVAYLVDRHPELQQIRDRLIQLGDDAPRDLRIEAGRLFDRVLTAERDQIANRALARLMPVCDDTATDPCRDTAEALNLACLVHRDQRADFEQAVERIATDLDEHHAIHLSGPWAPHHFVETDTAPQRQAA